MCLDKLQSRVVVSMAFLMHFVSVYGGFENR